MAYTSHGHHIPGTVLQPRTRQLVARCGGPSLCKQCMTEAGRYDAMTTTGPERSPFDHALPTELDLRQPNYD